MFPIIAPSARHRDPSRIDSIRPLWSGRENEWPLHEAGPTGVSNFDEVPVHLRAATTGETRLKMERRGQFFGLLVETFECQAAAPVPERI